MEKTSARILKIRTLEKTAGLRRKIEKRLLRMQHLSAEALLETITSIMFKMILFLGVPYFIFILIAFFKNF